MKNLLLLLIFFGKNRRGGILPLIVIILILGSVLYMIEYNGCNINSNKNNIQQDTLISKYFVQIQDLEIKLKEKDEKISELLKRPVYIINKQEIVDTFIKTEVKIEYQDKIVYQQIEGIDTFPTIRVPKSFNYQDSLMKLSGVIDTNSLKVDSFEFYVKVS